MKTKHLRTVLVVLILLISTNIIDAQKPEKKEMKQFELAPTKLVDYGKNLNDIFLSIVENVAYPKDKMCTSPEVFNLVKNSLKNEILTGDGVMSNVWYGITEEQKQKELKIESNTYGLEEKYDKGVYKTYGDRIHNAKITSKTFNDFVYAATGKDIGNLKTGEIKSLRDMYRTFGSFGRVPFYENDLYVKLNKECAMYWFPSFLPSSKTNSADYPNTIEEFKISVKIDCRCDEKGENKLKKSSFEYVADVNGIWTQKNLNFKRPAHPKINIKSVECCPDKEKEDESKTALNDSDHDNKGYLQVGAHIGLPLGEESDFYSLVFGADLAYLFNLSNDLSVGPKIGYTHFTGKEVGGFKVDGIGFIPVGGIIKYSFSNKISIDGNFGYTFSTKENIDGGINYGVGVGFEIAPEIVIRPEVSFINLGDSGNFNSFGIGFLYAFWRK